MNTSSKSKAAVKVIELVVPVPGQTEKRSIGTNDFNEAEAEIAKLSANLRGRSLDIIVHVTFENRLSWRGSYRIDQYGLDHKNRLLREAVQQGILFVIGKFCPPGTDEREYRFRVAEFDKAEVGRCQLIHDTCVIEGLGN